MIRRVVIVLTILSGCGPSAPLPPLQQARDLLQRSDATAALDTLAGLNGSSDIHYLRGVALLQLDKLDAARGEFDTAFEESDEPRIRACRLRLQLFARNLSAAEKLIALELDHPSDALVRLSCVYAYEALAVRLAAESRHEAAAAHRTRAARALATALTLASEIREFHPELLDFAVEYDQAAAALRLVRLIRKRNPNNAVMERREVRLLIALGEQEESIRRGRRLHLRSPDDPLSAELYASAMATASTSRSHDSTFRKLRKRFPGQIALIAQHARYLATNHKLTSACQILATALDSQVIHRRGSDDRWPLIQAAITLPLQAGSTGLAEQQLNRYRNQITDELLVTYFEGQLLHLQQDYDGAQQKMTEVLKARVDAVGRRDPLVTEAVRWLQRIRQAKGRRPATAS